MSATVIAPFKKAFFVVTKVDVRFSLIVFQLEKNVPTVVMSDACIVENSKADAPELTVNACPAVPNELKVYKSSGWAAAGSTVNGTSARFNYTATAAQTTFTGTDTNGETLAYDAGFADVYLNGVRLSGADITITSGTSVVLAVGASAGDILDVVAYGTFNVASVAASSITSGTLAIARGGTGLSAVGSANQVLATNSGASAMEWQTIQGGNITTEGETFSNYNQITDNITTTTSATSNMFLMGVITVANTKTWTIAGAGVLAVL